MHLYKPTRTVFYFYFALAIACVAYLRIQLNFNTAYADESDYLFVGTLLLDGISWQTKSYIFSSDIPLLIIGLANKLQGVIAGRFFSAILGLTSIVASYYVYLRFLNNKKLAIYSSFFLASSACHIFISKFATYDIICFLFFVSSLYFFQGRRDTAAKNNDTKYIVLGAILFSMAILSKYIVIAYFPFIALLLLYKKRQQFLLFSLLVGSIIGVYILDHIDALAILLQSQLMAVHVKNSTIEDVLVIMLAYMAMY